MDHNIKSAYEELYREDGLTIMGRGLGINYLYAKFCQLYSTIRSNQEVSRKLVFCINAGGCETKLLDLVLAFYPKLPLAVPGIINNEVSSQDRCDLYAEGGCYFITSRVLIVDLLDGKVDAAKVSGFLIFDAHRISEVSIESFILRVYRERNRDGFIKAFSEDPEQLQSRFGRVERLLRLLYIKKLYLWPRFRLEIVNILDKLQPEVIELSLPLTPHTKLIQSALLVAMNSCIAELKKSCPQMEMSNCTLENGLFHSFDVSIRNQLDQDWHRITFRSKQLVADLTTLRKLLDYLINYDSFSFYYMLLKIQSASAEQMSPSLWLTSEAADQIFKYAKARVYSIAAVSMSEIKSNQAASVTPEIAALLQELKADIKPSLECPPKWRVLVDIMKEVQSECAKQDSVDPFRRRVMLIAKDARTISQLRDVMMFGDSFVMDQRYRWFISQQAASIVSVASRSRCMSVRNIRTGNSRQAKRPREHPTGTEDTKVVESSVSIKIEENIADIQQLSASSSEWELPDAPPIALDTDVSAPTIRFGLTDKEFSKLSLENKLILIQEELLRNTAVSPLLNSRTSASSTESNKASNQSINKKDPAPASDAGSRKRPKPSSSSSLDNNIFSKAKKNIAQEDEIVEPELGISMVEPSCDVMLCTHMQLHESCTLLADYDPSYVVFYDPDIEIIRTIEVFQSSKAQRIRVYFLMHDGSAEEHRYVGALAKEKSAFESLITTKEHMVISLPDHPADVEEERASDSQLSLDTRNQFKKKEGALGRRKVVADVREFRSALPSMLHASRMALIPRTLQVGDYVLSPEICVERKGISDLFQSFGSGRLFNQAESMGRHYRYPCLLIEFNPEKPFSLMATSEISPEIQQSSIISKLSILAHNFPYLKFLWSRSAAATVDIFKAIIGNHEQVDINKAVQVGGGGLTQEGEEEGDAKHLAKDILLSLPGINDNNFRNVMSKVLNVAELSKMSEAALVPLIGPANAKKLHSFFNMKSL